MSLYSDYHKIMEDREAVYKTVTREQGRLKIGPSGKEGLYLSDSLEHKGVISCITEEEAKFIVRSLMEIYGMEWMMNTTEKQS